MDIQGTNTEPFVQFHRFHEEFGRNVRVTFGALEALRRSPAAESEEPSRVTVLPAGEEPWGTETHWTDVSTAARSAQRFLSEMGIVRVISAFEDLMVRVEAEHDRATSLMSPTKRRKKVKSDNSKISNTDVTSDSDEQMEARLRPFFDRLNWRIDPIVVYLPLLNYFSIARNCIVHRSGRASSAFVTLSQSKELLQSHASFPTRTGTKLPKLPSVSIDRVVQWLPRHAVMASAVCYEIAKYLNERLAQTIGDRGMVYMAAYHSLLAEERIPTGARRSTEIIVRHVLVDRYRAKETTISETIQILRNINKWQECLNAFQRIVAK